MKIIVIGSIEAGVSAASMLAAGTKGAQIKIYEKGRFYTCGTCGLPHFLTEDISVLKQAVSSKEEELRKAGIEAHLRHEVMSVNGALKQITVRDLETDREFTEGFDKLVIATGNLGLIPNVPGCERVGVQTFKNVEDLLFLKEFTKTPYVRDIVILGGSYSGLEMAKAFHRMGRHVHIIEKEKRLLPDFDQETADMIMKELEARGIRFSLGETVIAFPGKTYIEKVQTNRGSYDCDLCISAIGTVPNSEIAGLAGCQLDQNGFIIVNDKLETSVPGIYAIGSCTTGSGSILRTSSLHTAGLEIARTGLTEEECRKAGLRVSSVIAEGSDRPGICPNPHKVTIKLIYEAKTHRILGAQAWGEKNASARINAIAVAVSAGMTTEQLGNVGFVYSSSASSIWDPVQIVCNAVK